MALGLNLIKVNLRFSLQSTLKVKVKLLLTSFKVFSTCVTLKH